MRDKCLGNSRSWFWDCRISGYRATADDLWVGVKESYYAVGGRERPI